MFNSSSEAPRLGRWPILTSYFITTERVGWEAALASLRGQPVPQRVVVVRNVRPMQAAYARTLESRTPLTFLMDDDVILRSGSLWRMLWRFAWACTINRRVFLATSHLHDELFGRAEPHGVKMYRTDLLKRVGWPESSHLSPAQVQCAKTIGLIVRQWKHVVGTHLRGTPLDVYKRLLWIQIRWNTVRSTFMPPPPPDFFYRRWNDTQDVTYLCACLGLLDGLAVGTSQVSKDEQFLGPSSQRVNLVTPNAKELEQLVRELGVTSNGS